MAGGLFSQVRLVLIGRDHEPREVVFDSLGRDPVVVGVPMQWLGPVRKRAFRLLLLEAQNFVRRQGHHPDTFGIVGVGKESLAALVPRDPPSDSRESTALMRGLGIPVPPRWEDAGGR